jgi:hypothetical protein
MYGLTAFTGGAVVTSFVDVDAETASVHVVLALLVITDNRDISEPLADGRVGDLAAMGVKLVSIPCTSLYLGHTLLGTGANSFPTF